MSEFHQKVRAFIQCAASQDTCGNHAENNEISMFLMGLVSDHERQQGAAAEEKSGMAKTGKFAGPGSGVGLAIAP